MNDTGSQNMKQISEIFIAILLKFPREVNIEIL